MEREQRTLSLPRLTSDWLMKCHFSPSVLSTNYSILLCMLCLLSRNMNLHGWHIQSKLLQSTEQHAVRIPCGFLSSILALTVKLTTSHQSKRYPVPCTPFQLSQFSLDFSHDLLLSSTFTCKFGLFYSWFSTVFFGVIYISDFLFSASIINHRSI